MATNKRQKVDFSTALQEQAKKIAPKDDPADESYLANIDGEDVKFVRGDSTDAEWAAIKAKPAAVQRVTVKPAPGDKSPANTALVTRKQGETDAEWRGRALEAEKHPRYDATVETTEADQRDAKREQYKQLVANDAYEGGDGSLVSKDELKLLRKMNPEHAADFIEERIKKQEYEAEQKAKPPQTAPAQKPAPGERPADSADKFDYLTPEASNTTAPSSAGPGMSPLANAMQMATGATGNPMLDDIQEVAQPVVDSVVNQIKGPPIEQQPGIVPSLYRLGQKMDEVGADGAPLPGQPIPAGRNPDGTAKVDGVPGVESPPMPDPSMGPGNVSASLGVKIPGGFNPAQMDPKFAKNLDETIAAAHKRAGDLTDLQAANEVVQDGIVREAGKRRLEAEADMNREAGLAAQAKLNAVNEAQRYNGAKSVALEAAQKAAATPTDPNRFWNNKGAGQQAAAVIAGALFGFSGQGMQWLQRVDGLIEADNRLQVADRAANVSGLEAKARGFGEAADFAMKAGASESEAHIIARQMKYEGLKSYLEQATARSNNMQQKVQGQQMLLAIDSQLATLDQQAQHSNAMEVAQKNENLFRNATLQQGAARLSIAAEKASGAHGVKLTPQQQTVISQATAGLAMLPALEKAIGNPNESIGVALKDQIAKQFPGTDANNRDIEAAFLNRNIFSSIDRSVINNADQKWLDLFQSSPGIASLKRKGAVSALKRMLTDTRNAAIRTGSGLQQNLGTIQESPGDNGFDFQAEEP